MISTKFITRKDRVSINGYPIVLYINLNGKRLNFYTDVTIKERDYLSNNKISKKDKLYSEKNAKLTKLLADTNIILLKETDAEIIKENINNLLKHIVKKDKLLIDYIEEFMLTKRHIRTAKLYQCTINKIKSFNANVKIENINKRWLIEFENYCSKNMKVNGYSVYMRNIRSVFNYFLEEGKITNYPFKAYKIKKESTIHRALNIQELKKLISYNKDSYLIKYRDAFLLMIYLIGINPKDLLHLTKDSLVEGRIEYRRFKTRRLYSIKLEPEAQEVVSKYGGESHLIIYIEKNKDYLGFVRNMNKGLKKLCKEINIPVITSYWARHTWASIAFECGVSKDIISLALGHSNGVKVTDIYIKYDLAKVDEANRKVIDYIKEK